MTYEIPAKWPGWSAESVADIALLYYYAEETGELRPAVADRTEHDYWDISCGLIIAAGVILWAWAMIWVIFKKSKKSKKRC